MTATKAETHRACPKCSSQRVHRSRRRGALERLLGLIGAKVNRCHACNFRFLRLGGSTLLLDDVKRAANRILLAVATVMALATVLAIVLWFSGKQASFTPADSGAFLLLG